MNAESFPALFRDADACAAEAQRQFMLCIAGNALLSILAVIFAAYAPASEVSGVIAAVLALILIGLAVLQRVKGFEKIWYKNRAIAESVKTMTWRYAMRSEPFDEDSRADNQFVRRLQKLIDSNKTELTSLVSTVSNFDQVTDEMKENREKGVGHRISIYKNDRIQDQLDWYHDKARQNHKMGKRWFYLMISAYVVAILLILVQITRPDIRLPSDALIVAAAGCLTWMQVKKFNELKTAYTVTAHEIGLLGSKLKETMTEAEFSEFVSDAENAFSREHTQWIARQDHP